MSQPRGDPWDRAADAAAWSRRRLARVGPVRRAVVRVCESRLVAQATAPGAHVRHPRAAQADRLALSLAMLRIVERVLADNRISHAAFRGLVQRLIRDVQLRKGTVATLDDVWRQRFFRSVRDWQRAQGYREEGERYAGGANWMMPCLIRDHHRDFRKLVLEHRPQPAGEDARAALEDPGYARGLEDFGRRLADLTDPLWEARYLEASEGPASPGDEAVTAQEAGAAPPDRTAWRRVAAPASRASSKKV